jgi:hypothetical protein
MNRSATQKSNQNEKLATPLELPSSLKKKYLITIFTLTILSILNISLKSDKVNSNIWSFSIEVKVTSLTVILVLLLWLPILLPWILTQFPQLKGSLNWLREQGIEEVETNLLRIKLRYGVQEATQNYEEKIWDRGATSTELNSQETYQAIEKQYQDVLASIETASNIDPAEALSRIDQLATYYDRIREEMPAGSNRTRLMREISSTMWALVTKTIDFPIQKKLNSPKAGERLSAYKYLEWQPTSEYLDLLLSRAVGVLEMPFSQYAALLALRRVVTTHPPSSSQAKEITDLLTWVANLDYIKRDRSRQKLMLEIASILATSA